MPGEVQRLVVVFVGRGERGRPARIALFERGSTLTLYGVGVQKVDRCAVEEPVEIPSRRSRHRAGGGRPRVDRSPGATSPRRAARDVVQILLALHRADGHFASWAMRAISLSSKPRVGNTSGGRA